MVRTWSNTLCSRRSCRSSRSPRCRSSARRSPQPGRTSPTTCRRSGHRSPGGGPAPHRADGPRGAEGTLVEGANHLGRTPLGAGEWGWYIAFGAVVVASVIDWRTRRIPNLLTFPLVFAALVGNKLVGCWTVAISSLVGLVVVLAFFLLLILLGAMGPGDVKLMAALGALLGIVHVFWIGLFTAVMGGVLAVLYSLSRGSLPRLANRTWRLVKFIVLTGRLPQAEELQASREDYMPYALAIALGVAAQYLYRGGS